MNDMLIRNLLLNISTTVGIAIAVGSCSPAGGRHIDNPQSLARTISMLRRGEGINTEYRVLFYGQSITDHRWTDLAASHLRAMYPKVRFRFANMAIGGNAAPLLARAVARDTEAFYPDLVVFHVYGGKKDYRSIIETIRAKTAAEVILQTDHLRERVEPLCPVGLNMRFGVPSGCVGHVWLHQRNWDDYMSNRLIPEAAHDYGLAVEPRRQRWDAYLARHKIQPAQLLVDGTHPNDEGWRLAAALFTTWFDWIVQDAPTRRQKLISFITLSKATDSTYSAYGNRFELLTREPLQNAASIHVDGVPIKAIRGCWTTSRTTSIPWIAEWPAIRQVSVAATKLTPDDWSATLYNFNKDMSRFDFNLRSRTRGDEGSGNSAQRFVSKSGDIAIEPDDWVFKDAMALRPVALPQTLVVRWSHRFTCGRQTSNTNIESGSEIHYLLATGLPNGRHDIRIVSSSLAVRSGGALMSFTPALLN